MTDTKTQHSSQVIKWSTPSGDTLDVCTACEERLRTEQAWPRSPRNGEEYCQVQMGLHFGECDLD